MKIYEFTVTDKHQFSKKQIDVIVTTILEEEADFQRWVPGYQCEQVKIENLDNNEVRYHFEVMGRFEDFELADGNDRSSDNQFKTDSIAARPAEL